MSQTTIVAGWVLSALISLIFLGGAYAQFTFDVNTNTNVPSFPHWFHLATAIALLFAAVMHLMPDTSMATLGAIIMTGMIGGMIGTLMLQGNGMWWTRVPMGILPWLGLYLRNADFNDLMSFWR